MAPKDSRKKKGGSSQGGSRQGSASSSINPRQGSASSSAHPRQGSSSSSGNPRQRNRATAQGGSCGPSRSASESSQRPLEGRARSLQSQAASELAFRMNQDDAQQTASSAGPSQVEPPDVHNALGRGKGGARVQGGRSLGAARPLLSQAQRVVDQHRGDEASERTTRPLTVEVFDFTSGQLQRVSKTVTSEVSTKTAIATVTESIQQASLRAGEPVPRQRSPGRDPQASRASSTPASSSQRGQADPSASTPTPLNLLPPLPAPNFLPPLPTPRVPSSAPTFNFMPHSDLPPPRLGPAPPNPGPTLFAVGNDEETHRHNQVVALQSEAQKCHLEAIQAFVRMNGRSARNMHSRYEDRDALNNLLRSMTVTARTINSFPDLTNTPNGLRLAEVLKDQLPKMLTTLTPEIDMRETYVETMRELVFGVKTVLNAIQTRFEQSQQPKDPANLPYAFRILRRKLNQKMPILRLEMGICHQDVKPLMDCVKELQAWKDPEARVLSRKLRPWLENALRAQEVVRNIDDLLNRYDDLGRRVGGDSWLTASIGLGATEEEIDREAGVSTDFVHMFCLLDAMGENPNRAASRR